MQSERSDTVKNKQWTCPECDGSAKCEKNELVCSECGIDIHEEAISRELQWELTPDGDGESIVTGSEIKTDGGRVSEADIEQRLTCLKRIVLDDDQEGDDGE